MIEKTKNIRLNTMQMIALGFVGVIFLGGVLLWLPICNEKPISFLDAMFTSVTSVCVTGLVTIVPATQFTIIGKVILLILIQIGGLGVIACTFAFFLLMKKKITMKERVIIQQAYSLDTLSGMVQFIIRILQGTFLVEGIGALLYAAVFVPKYGIIKGIVYGIFHSVSAFCNAGIDILGDDSLLDYVSSPIINFTTMFLIIMGGLGFIVWYDVKNNAQNIIRHNLPKERIFTRLTLQTKVVLVMTGLLILTGTVGVFVLEYNNPATMEGLNFGEKLMASAFHSVTTRTAGFATVSQAGLREGTKLLTCILMFIGGSPGGTAGGVKTTTIAMLLLTCLSVVRGKHDTECFDRKIASDTVRTGIVIIMITFVFLLTGVTIITVLEPSVDFMRILFEGTSAIATVGLTADLTPQLGSISKAVVMALMYIGRIGPITMALVFGGRPHLSTQHRELPEKQIMVG